MESCCCGLCFCPPRFMCWNLIPCVSVLRGGNLGRVLSQKCRELACRIGVRIKRPQDLQGGSAGDRPSSGQMTRVSFLVPTWQREIKHFYSTPLTFRGRPWHAHACAQMHICTHTHTHRVNKNAIKEKEARRRFLPLLCENVHWSSSMRNGLPWPLFFSHLEHGLPSFLNCVH